VASDFEVLFICTGNIHRSALAQALFRRWADWYLPGDVSGQVRVVSAGTQAPRHRAMSGRTRGIAEKLGADGSGHRTTVLTSGHIEAADLILTASEHHRDVALQWDPTALRRTFTIREAARTAGAIPQASAPRDVDEMRARVRALAEHRVPAADPRDNDITDPQGRPPHAFAEMAREEVPALADLAVVLFGMGEGDRGAYHRAAEDDSLRPA
jgi:protein-tyrosine phosphatase